MPVAQVSASLQLPQGFAVEGYYQFEWRKTRQPGSGSYFSSSDYYDAGEYIRDYYEFLKASQEFRKPILSV